MLLLAASLATLFISCLSAFVATWLKYPPAQLMVIRPMISMSSEPAYPLSPCPLSPSVSSPFNFSMAAKSRLSSRRLKSTSPSERYQSCMLPSLCSTAPMVKPPSTHILSSISPMPPSISSESMPFSYLGENLLILNEKGPIFLRSDASDHSPMLK